MVDWQVIVAAVAALSMIWGNIAALTQTNVKRMLAYSSIAHAGYILLGVLAASATGLWAAMFYVLAYTFFTLGAFGTVILLERREYAGETISDYAGLARRAPLLAVLDVDLPPGADGYSSRRVVFLARCTCSRPRWRPGGPGSRWSVS